MRWFHHFDWLWFNWFFLSRNFFHWGLFDRGFFHDWSGFHWFLNRFFCDWFLNWGFRNVFWFWLFVF